MDIWAVEKGKLAKYTRTGECKQCGRCCYKHTISYQMRVAHNAEEAADDDEDWSEWEGWSLFFAQGIWWYYKIESIGEPPERCSSLSEENKCEIWKCPEGFKPICRYWPFHPDQVAYFPGCGFTFEKEE